MSKMRKMFASRGNRIFIAAIAVALTAAGAALLCMLSSQSNSNDDIVTGPTASKIPVAVTTENVGDWVDSLPPTAAGQNDLSLLRPSSDASLARGRVQRVYVRAAQGLLVELPASQRQRREGWRYVELDFGEPLLNGTTNALALVPSDGPEVGVGDVVEMRFAASTLGKQFGSGALPQRDKVVALVTSAGSPLADDYQRRIAARSRAGGAVDDPVQLSNWGKLPTEKAIKIVRGNGTRELAVFSDPYCSACQAFEQTLKQIDDVTVYVFMLPVIHKDKADQSRSVWCSADRVQAWQDLALEHKLPQAPSTCDNPVDAVLAMRESVGVRSTPTIFFRDGKRVEGNMQVITLRERLAQSASGSKLASAR